MSPSSFSGMRSVSSTRWRTEEQGELVGWSTLLGEVDERAMRDEANQHLGVVSTAAGNESPSGIILHVDRIFAD